MTTTMTTIDPVLRLILDQLPERDQRALLEKHEICSAQDLIIKKSLLQQRQLEGVCADVQMCLEHMCSYLASLDSDDDHDADVFSRFSWEGFANFCGFTDNSGDYLMDIPQKKKQKKQEAADPDGYNLTSEERKQMEEAVQDDPLTMKIRGFSDQHLHFDFNDHEKKKEVEDASDKNQVAFNGKVYYRRKCYRHQQKNGATVTVGILSFTTNEKKAICTLVVPFFDTVMGPALVEVPPVGVVPTYEEDPAGLPAFVQVYRPPGSEPILPLSSLTPVATTESDQPNDIPELIFEPQQPGQSPHNFGYVYENDGTNRASLRTETIRFVDLFAGSGGYHQGVMQVPGFQGVAAVEYWDKACETFRKNHPDTPVFHQKVEDFLEESGPSTTDFRKKHGNVLLLLASPPCQSFSGSNRDVDHNSEKDLYRKGLSLKFFDAVQVSGALIGVFENVEGMWRRPNVYFLKKIVVDHIRAGYQVRVRLHRAKFFGDPQDRPRLLIYVAKKFVEMPNVTETHGRGKHPFVTAGNALTALAAALKKDPDLPNQDGSKMDHPNDEKDILRLHEPAGTIRCGGRAWHPTLQRCITVREAATLQSYPYDYEFLGTLTDQYKQVGNAVPGQMAKVAVGQAVATSLRYVYAEESDDNETLEQGFASQVCDETEAKNETVSNGMDEMDIDNTQASDTVPAAETTETEKD